MKMDSRVFCKKKVSGFFPEDGAIFMSNRSTLKECFERSLFGLPDTFSGFVKNVKAGMILFLFEFEERKLYGVFKAITDGGMNIVPHAYASSGKQYPSQVVIFIFLLFLPFSNSKFPQIWHIGFLFLRVGIFCFSCYFDKYLFLEYSYFYEFIYVYGFNQVKFTTILHCDPLFEDEFCDVIRDNYFSTYKFNFGLCKDQIEGLMWLFNSRKHEVPHSLHQKRKRKRKWDFQIIENELMKGRFTNTQKRKLVSNDGASVTDEQEVENLSLSPRSCGNCKSIQFHDDAYDPENPGFNHSVGSGAHSAASYESHELPSFQNKKGNLPILEEETEDFIPLCSTDNSDLEDGELDDFSESSEEKQIGLDMLEGNEVSYIPVPRFLMSDKESNRLCDSSPTGVSNLQSKDETDTLPSKGMYSDKTKNRTSVFSRLNFLSKGITSENQNDINGKDIAKYHYRYGYQKMEEVAQQIEDGRMYKRASVFMRLTSVSDTVPQIHSMTGLDDGTRWWKKGR
ncbi:uncharacterized protein LOC127130565 isoform X4 [Lathyrus oleraceus]|uniref:DCD domain-containing protein n=1 Tax=Pisum sativum TaxID=3888 RepID=A0A9D5B9I7_PEA|nr:uncharacterized protein LOC127130565 isoform X3 [Pisum sativum]XP_050915715.1 uncharacterized protein LOC127130565 isoform X4 [Pisum sativum]KAI5440722.1 hypothetical protein KIW84_010264 [Pisum sativum]